MNKNQLDGLIALKLIATKRNFSAAAEELGVSPPAISKMIKQLEARLGVALLSRTTRSTSLTEAGALFLSEAGPGLEQIFSALGHVKSYSDKPSGLLRLSLPRLIYPSYLAPIVSSFVKKYPEITVDLFFDDTQVDVVEKGFDAGIRLSDILANDMIALKLFGPVKFVTAASPKYLDRAGRPKHPKELLAHNCIRVRFGEAELYDRWEFESKGKPFEVKVTGSLIFNDTNLMITAATGGTGIIYVPEAAIKDKINTGKLEVVLNQYSAASTGFYLYYPKKSQVLPKLRVFIDHIKASAERL
ncbi:MAG: LysR family transcriptional regulator [Micavibrio sp.]|nr:LysR family transcriptional regulator [Micavibrio sp.]